MVGLSEYGTRLPADMRLRSLWAMVALLLVGLISAFRFVLILILAFNRGESDYLMALYWAITDWYTIVEVVTLVAFIVWLYGAHTNLSVFGRSSRFKTAATVYWWFVPIANLFMPYQVVAELQEEMVALGTDDWQDRDPVIWWWSLLVGGVILYLVSIQFDAQPGAAISWPLILEAVAAAALAVSAYFGIRLIRRITGLQLG